jgi:hypothetical protein
MANLFLHLAQRASGSAIVPRPVLAPLLPPAPAEAQIAQSVPAAVPQAELANDLTPAKVAEPASSTQAPAAPAPPVKVRESESPRAPRAARQTAPSPPAIARAEPTLSPGSADRVVATTVRAPDADPPVSGKKHEEARELARVPAAVPRERATLAAVARELRPAPVESPRRDTADSTVVEVSIGRIDVHQAAPARAPASRPAPASRHISLGDYLGGKRRN